MLRNAMRQRKQLGGAMMPAAGAALRQPPQGGPGTPGYFGSALDPRSPMAQPGYQPPPQGQGPNLASLLAALKANPSVSGGAGGFGGLFAAPPGAGQPAMNACSVKATMGPSGPPPAPPPGGWFGGGAGGAMGPMPQPSQPPTMPAGGPPPPTAPNLGGMAGMIGGGSPPGRPNVPPPAPTGMPPGAVGGMGGMMGGALGALNAPQARNMMPQRPMGPIGPPGGMRPMPVMNRGPMMNRMAMMARGGFITPPGPQPSSILPPRMPVSPLSTLMGQGMAGQHAGFPGVRKPRVPLPGALRNINQTINRGRERLGKIGPI